jgi:hypothetical protein
MAPGHKRLAKWMWTTTGTYELGKRHAFVWHAQLADAFDLQDIG